MTTAPGTSATDIATRLRFMRIDQDTRGLVREFWKILEPSCRRSSMPSTLM